MIPLIGLYKYNNAKSTYIYIVNLYYKQNQTKKEIKMSYNNTKLWRVLWIAAEELLEMRHM